jgi:hypothetical protein
VEHPGCWQASSSGNTRLRRARRDWQNRGWNDACNVNLEYPKHWNASYLVTYGLVDNFFQSFHGTADYRAAGEAAGSVFHNSLYHSIKDDNGVFGAFQPTAFGPDILYTSCPLYNRTVSNANPGSRSGDYMHEGWHAWLRKYGWNNGSVGGHRPGPQGNCTFNGCDYFYFHGISAYAFGAMYQTDGTANRFHSPNQVQVEYLCDVSDQPKWWVPASVRLAAALHTGSGIEPAAHRLAGWLAGFEAPLEVWKSARILGLALERVGRQPEALRAFETAAGAMRAIAAGTDDEGLRSGFLSSPPVREVLERAGS